MTDLILSHISKRFGEKEVLRDLSATFPAGSITCIMGASGSGKTTLLRIIWGLERPDSGTISGRPAQISAVFQDNRLFEEFTPVSNVTAVMPGARQAHRAAAVECLSALGLEDSLHLPTKALSGGMKRRVAIARALLSPGELLVFDEPFTGLDSETKVQTIACVQAFRRGRTLLFVTHDAYEQQALAEFTLQLP